MKKTIYTLCVDNYQPAITALTFPLMQEFAWKIRADFYVIKERKFPQWPITMEKLQIYDLARERGDDWAWYLDADTLVHPEMYDVTEMVPKNTVFHNGSDMASIRWTYDHFFRRDGRHFGSCNWCTGASDWCLDLWHPLEDLTLEQALENIHITVAEEKSGCCVREHLIDDYVLSRNIARYGLKAITIAELIEQHRLQPYFWHKYAISNEQKLAEMLAVLSTRERQPAFGEAGTPVVLAPGAPPVIRTPDNRIVPACGMGWDLMDTRDLAEFREQWGVRDAPAPENVYVQPNPPIQGWMSPEELQWLYEMGQKYKVIAEVGCWFGRSTHALLSGNLKAFGQDGVVYAVDHFKGSPSERETTHAYAKEGDVYMRFMANCGSFSNLKVCRSDSEVAAKGKDVDMVFLDGEHTFESVASDLYAWIPSVRPGGLISGHDVQEPGVQQALWKYFSEPPLRVGETSIWMVDQKAI